ncbi:MAG: phage holin family protein [Flavobacterium sp.]|jgi:putative membrane protein|uniref:phage holin family protein n=1 Tax=Flavobacterium sp. TaxID=239 RepID=UPI0022BFFEDE|nr:phage holin family protein [Flavobacterium sp.]MCZ8167793.1 phage holin family protein [Flavobacterium sp.]MCZ8297558.1 phage holin family protein [Flavobacterium sp.]
MKKLIVRVLVTALLVMIIPYFLKGIVVDAFTTALTVALVLGVLNLFVKPIFVLFTLPITVFSLGLFLLVINGMMIMLCDYFVDGFDVKNIGWAMLFSIVLSLSQSLVYRLTELKK